MVKNAVKFREEGAIIDRILKYYRDSNDTIEQKKETIQQLLFEILKIEADSIGYSVTMQKNGLEQYDFQNDEKIDLIFLSDDKRPAGDHVTPVMIDSTDNPKYGAPYIVVNTSVFEDIPSIGSVARLIRTALHEMQHVKQFSRVKQNETNRETLNFAREYALTKLASFPGDFRAKFDKLYHSNHGKFLIESDADEYAIMTLFESSNHGNYFLPQLTQSLNQEYIHAKEGAFNPEFSDYLDDLLSENVDEYLIKMFPALGIEFNPDGTKKTAEQLVSDLTAKLVASKQLPESEQEESRTSYKDLYFHLIYRAVEREKSEGRCNQEYLSHISDIYLQYENNNLFEDMTQYYSSQIDTINKSGIYLSQDKQEKLEKYYSTIIDNIERFKTEPVLFEDQDIGKTTVDVTTTKKHEAQTQVTRDEQELEQGIVKEN